MSLVKALSKLRAKGASRQITKIQVSNAGDKAYKEIGKQMQATRKQGKFINGSKTYRANKRIIIKKLIITDVIEKTSLTTYKIVVVEFSTAIF